METVDIAKIEEIHSLVQKELTDGLNSCRQSRIAPMSVSKFLRCLHRVRDTLVTLLGLAPSLQERNAWLILNATKLIAEIGQPLIWYNCGKYVVESFVFSAKCLEHVISLCTTRHLPFRMKFYSDAFYGALTQLGTKEAENIVIQARKQLQALRERESADPPIPQRIETILNQTEVDIGVLQSVLDFWKDPEGFSLVGDEALKNFPDDGMNTDRPIEDRVLCELARVQQLTTGNPNEMWKKRSSAILKIFSGYLQSRAADHSNSSKSPPVTLPCLSSMITIAMFDSIEGVDIESILQMSFDLARTQFNFSENEDDVRDDSLRELLVLHRLASVIRLKPSDEEASDNEGRGDESERAMESFMDAFTHFVFSEHAQRRSALVRRVAIGLWSKHLYGWVQGLLSRARDSVALASSNQSARVLKIARLLQTVVVGLDMTETEDPSLVCSMQSLAAQLYLHIGDPRSSIGILRRAIEDIDVYRAGLVDVRLQMAEDSRDILALQTASFTSYRREEDWFHSVKRLGAHAFAGCGIFGAGSSGDRLDQSLADIQTDLVLTYFRAELTYAQNQRLLKLRFHKSRSGQKSTAAGNTSIAEEIEVDAERLLCVPSLRSFSSKNDYWRCLLALEMARIDTDRGRKEGFLESALGAIEACEESEHRLRASFSSFVLVSSESNGPPIVLSRSNRYIYVAPTASRKMFTPSTQYFRVLAKELGSGTDVTLSSDYLPGTESRVSSAAMLSYPTTCAVRIGPLRPGERYVFGCAAFDGSNNVIGAVSPTSTSVDAVNPLPTALLWNYLNRVAVDLMTPRISSTSALRLCGRYFGHPTEIDALVVGKGINRCIDQEPLVCQLAAEQSTSVDLEAFALSFVSLSPVLKGSFQAASGRSRSIQPSIHWNVRMPEQKHLRTSIRKTVLVATAAVRLQSHSTLLQAIVLGFNLLSEVLDKDHEALSEELLTSTLSFLVCLQSVPMRNWQLLEHQVYCRLATFALKMSLYAHNTTMTVAMLKSFFACGKDLTSLPEQADREYIGLYQDLKMGCNVFVNGDPGILGHFKEFLVKVGLKLEEGWTHHPEQLWQKSSPLQLAYFIGASEELRNASAEVSIFEKVLQTLPMRMSDFLSVLVVIGREVLSRGHFPGGISALLNKFPVFVEQLSSEFLELKDEWKLEFLAHLPSPEELAASAAAAAAADGKKAKDAKGKGPPAAAAAVPAEEAPAVPERFTVPLRFSELPSEEIRKQYALLGELAVLVANEHRAAYYHREFYPSSEEGPLLLITPGVTPVEALLDQARLAAEVKKASAEQVSKTPEHEAEQAAGGSSAAAKAPPKGGKPPAAGAAAAAPDQASVRYVPERLVRSSIDFLRYKLAAVVLLCRSGSPVSAISECSEVWNYVVERWIDPIEFVAEFPESTALALPVLSSLFDVLEEICGFTAYSSNSVNESAMTSSTLTRRCESGYSATQFTELSFLAQGLLIFLLKLLWLAKDFANVVELGTRLVTLYIRRLPDICKVVGEHVVPLVLHAQQEIVEQARASLANRNKELEKFVADYEEAQRKKRKKKLRIARLEKDEDELKFEADRDAFAAEVQTADNLLQECLLKLEDIESLKKSFDTLFPTGAQMLKRARQSAKQLMSDCWQEFGQLDNVKARKEVFDYRPCLMQSRELLAKFEDVMLQYANVGHFLREKKDRLTLVEALAEQGDLLTLFGRIAEAGKVWNDVVDGYFNTMEAVNDWHNVISNFRGENFPTHLMSGVLPVVAVLGKLSFHCAANDWDQKSAYCRLAAELCRIPFAESFSHPVKLVGFAAYECQALGGVHALAFNSEKLNGRSLVCALQQIVEVLLSEDVYLPALPVAVLLEHFHMAYSKRPDEWLAARLQRVHLLIKCRLFSQAAAMIAGIVPSIEKLTKTECVESTTATADHFDTSKNGFCYFGRAPFWNHLPPQDDQNKACNSWIASFPDELTTILSKFVVQIPISALSPYELEERERKKKEAEEQAAAAATAAAAKTKGKKGEEPPAPVAAELPPPSRPFFSEELVDKVYFCCGLFLLEQCSIDSRKATGHRKALDELVSSGEKLVRLASEKLRSTAKVNSSDWLRLLGDCEVALAWVELRSCRFRTSRERSFGLLQFLQHSHAAISNVTWKFHAALLWMNAMDLLCENASRQSRFENAVTLSTASAKQASNLVSSHWTQTFLFKRAICQLKLGNVTNCLSDCQSLETLFENKHRTDTFCCRVLCLAASGLRQQLVSVNSDKAYFELSVTILKKLRSARAIAESCAREYGFFGADSNSSFFSTAKVEMTYDNLPPYLHCISEIHSNVSELSLLPRGATDRAKGSKVAAEVSGQKSSSGWNNRKAATDSTETVYTDCEFGNIYLLATRVLATTHSALALALDEIRNSKAASADDPGAGASNSSGSGDASVSQNKFNQREVLLEQQLIAEDGLKVLRHVVFASSFVRTSLLVSVGRVRTVLNGATEGNDIMKPLNAALEIGVFGISHPFGIMRSAAVELVELLGSQNCSSDIPPPSRLKAAAMYLITAIKLNNQASLLRNDISTICKEKCFLSPLSAAMSSFVESFQSEPPRIANHSIPPRPAVTGRDALLLLNTICRECDFYWLDGYEFDVVSDLHSLLKAEYPVYKERFALPGVPNFEANLVVSKGALSTLWMASAKSDSRGSTNTDLTKNDEGVFDFITAYFLLSPLATPSDIAAATTDSKNAKKGGGGGRPPSATSSDPPSDPVMTKALVNQHHVVSVESRIRRLRERTLYDQARNRSLQPHFEEFRHLLEETLGLFASDVTEVKSAVVETSSGAVVRLEVGDRGKATIACDGDVMQRLADLLNSNFDVDAMIDNSLCCLFRLALGFDVEGNEGQ